MFTWQRLGYLLRDGSIFVRSASSAADRISRDLFDAARRNVDDLVQNINLVSFCKSVLVCCHHTCGALENDQQLGSISQCLVMDERIRSHIRLPLPIRIEIEHYELYRLESVRHLESSRSSVVRTDQVLRSLWLQDSAKFRAEIL
jgi:hypothetical protein